MLDILMSPESMRKKVYDNVKHIIKMFGLEVQFTLKQRHINSLPSNAMERCHVCTHDKTQ